MAGGSNLISQSSLPFRRRISRMRAKFDRVVAMDADEPVGRELLDEGGKLREISSPTLSALKVSTEIEGLTEIRNIANMEAKAAADRGRLLQARRRQCPDTGLAPKVRDKCLARLV